MAQYKAFSSGVEVNGETVMAIVDGLGIFKNTALKILEENGISNPVKGSWYLQQAWLNSFKEIAETIGQRTLMEIGTKIPDNAIFPSGIENIEKALAAIDIAYHLNHRGGEIGSYKFEKLGEGTVKITCNNPYPCNFDKGIIFAMANKYKPENVFVNLDHVETAPCRNKGDDSCTYIVKWDV